MFPARAQASSQPHCMSTPPSPTASPSNGWASRRCAPTVAAWRRGCCRALAQFRIAATRSTADGSTAQLIHPRGVRAPSRTATSFQLGNSRWRSLYGRTVHRPMAAHVPESKPRAMGRANSARYPSAGEPSMTNVSWALKAIHNCATTAVSDRSTLASCSILRSREMTVWRCV